MASVTDTQLKLSDAASQMNLARRHVDDEPTFRSCINSFLSAARSVTFVMQKESGGSSELAEWYAEQQGKLTTNPLMRFFNDRRIHSIHVGAVKLDKKHFPVAGLQEKISEVPGRGEVRQVTVRVNTPSAPASPGDVISVRNGGGYAWQFAGIEEFLPGHSGNVFRLCEDYFLVLKD